MSRDIYPHDRIPDIFYINAVSPWDAKAEKDTTFRDLLESGVARLDADAQGRYKQVYLEVPAEGDRVVLLQAIELTPFFNKARSDLVVAFYNQPDMWHRFGYEGSSAEYGGYIHRGFNDINWLPKV